MCVCVCLHIYIYIYTGTWNIMTMLKAGKMNEIANENFKFQHPHCVGYMKNVASGRVNTQLK